MDKKLDVAAAYPTGGIVFNISRETTKRELVSIQGIPENVSRMQNINLLSGSVNAIEYSVAMFGLPDLLELSKQFDLEHA